ncbi:hypothetical protein WS62_15430 [Burkholderia sp. ABCPW 14]|nr:hypothetical protein WS62_15430 [Burkholderia sp. ABCPW 14]
MTCGGGSNVKHGRLRDVGSDDECPATRTTHAIAAAAFAISPDKPLRAHVADYTADRFDGSVRR